MGFWKRLFKREPVEILVVEVEAPRKNVQFGVEAARSMAALNAYPGFKLLLHKLKLQRAALEAALKGGRFKSIREVYFLQAGIYWAGWLENTLDQAAERAVEKTKPTEAELEVFQGALKQIELVGQGHK